MPSDQTAQPLSARTKAGRLLLMSGLTFHSGRRLADSPELVVAIEDEALDAARQGVGAGLDEALLAEAIRRTFASPMSYEAASREWAEQRAAELAAEYARLALRQPVEGSAPRTPKRTRTDWSNVVVDEGDEAP